MKALIDFDIVAYRCSYKCKDDSEEDLFGEINSFVIDIINRSKSDCYEGFLTSSSSKYPKTEKTNFRKLIYPEYKDNRQGLEAPVHLDAARKFLVDEWKAIVCEGYEADDALGMAQDYSGRSSVICTIDKDLDQIPGKHYNWIKDKLYEVSEIEGIRSLYRSALVGDRSDNIFGVSGIGEVKAKGIIPDDLEDEQEMHDRVASLYDSYERFCMNMQCLYIWRNPT